jgi:U32 family peptidase
MTKPNLNKIQLLAPAGNFAAVIAAVENGADAVYFGSKLFNARRLAHNFDTDELKKAVQYCHLHGVKVNLTLNILIKNDEIVSFLNQVSNAAALGIDGIIMQDLTFAPIIKKHFPHLEIHASTQSTIMNSAAVNFWKKYVNVFVLARELTKQEVQEMYKNTKANLEVFVHGHLCISYSGQCLISSLIGKRSGNRGMCASSCRKEYNGNTYLLSAKDLCMINNIKDVVESGVKTVKIEGRMKSAEYVATTTRYYREQIDSYYANKKVPVTKKTIKDLKLAFNRDFTKGYFNNVENIVDPILSSKRGIFLGTVQKGHVILQDAIQQFDGITTLVDGEREGGFVSKITDENDNILLKAKAGQKVKLGIPGFKNSAKIFLTSSHEGENLLGNITQIPIELEIKVSVGKETNISITVMKKKLEFNLPSKATVPKKHPVVKKDITKQFSKYKSQIFHISKINVETDNSFIPKSELTTFRNTLDNQILDVLVPIQKLEKIPAPIFVKNKATLKQLHVLVYDIYGVEQALRCDADIIYYDLFASDFNDAKKIAGSKLYGHTPMVLTDSHCEEIKTIVQKIKPAGILANNVGLLNLGLDCEIILGYQMNIFNDNQIAFYNKNSVASIELNVEEIKEFAHKEQIIYYAHGKPAVMTFKEEFNTESLTDGKGYSFDLRYNYTSTEMLYSKTIAILQHTPLVLQAGIKQLFLDVEENVFETVQAYRAMLDGKRISINNLKKGVTIGNLEKGVM